MSRTGWKDKGGAVWENIFLPSPESGNRESDFSLSATQLPLFLSGRGLRAARCSEDVGGPSPLARALCPERIRSLLSALGA